MKFFRLPPSTRGIWEGATRRPKGPGSLAGFFLAAVGFVLLPFPTELLAQTSGARDFYRVGPRDMLQVRVDELPSLDGEHEVGEDGTIQLGVVGRLEASGLTESELALRIRSRLLEEGLRKASVTVSVTEFRSRPVSVLAAAGTPGNHFVPGRSTLLEVILAVGGLAADHGSSIQVRRRAHNGLTDQVEIEVRDLIQRGDPRVNIPIYAGDLINVPPAREIVISFLGEVATAGSVTFQGNKRVTLLMAIARAGGLSETASNKISVKRQNAAGEWQETVVDYRRLLAGKEPDMELQDGDLIVVKESFF